MATISPEQALDHPTWKMGPKITVDSATLMNKGFEVIEASWLFDVDIECVDVVIHRQSVVHSLVEFVDGSMLAHLGKADMLLPIQYALTHPARRPAPLGRLELEQIGQLTFAAPDRENFPCLDLCYRAGRSGGTAPALLNAANEVAVGAFLREQISFVDIATLNAHVLNECVSERVEELEVVLAADRMARHMAQKWLDQRA
jgi:1-deoxy-D-xylulose-5-phosphate reductoisomerase